MYWRWQTSGLALAACFLAAVVLVKPIGVSTQFVIVDGLIAAQFNPGLISQDPQSKSGYSSTNAYLNKSGGKYAKAVAEPINYSLVFVLAMVVGGLLGAKLGRQPVKQVPEFHRRAFKDSKMQRYSFAFVGGVIVLLGARLAGGCTSGHMMSGMMQTAISGYLFAAAAFIAAIPMAIMLYKQGGND